MGCSSLWGGGNPGERCTRPTTVTRPVASAWKRWRRFSSSTRLVLTSSCASSLLSWNSPRSRLRVRTGRRLFIKGLRFVASSRPSACEKCSAAADGWDYFRVMTGTCHSRVTAEEFTTAGFLFSRGGMLSCAKASLLHALSLDHKWTELLLFIIILSLFSQTLKILSSCSTGHQPMKWKSLTRSAVIWSELWARILPTRRWCTSSESRPQKVGCDLLSDRERF